MPGQDLLAATNARGKCQKSYLALQTITGIDTLTLLGGERRFFAAQLSAFFLAVSTSACHYRIILVNNCVKGKADAE